MCRHDTRPSVQGRLGFFARVQYLSVYLHTQNTHPYIIYKILVYLRVTQYSTKCLAGGMIFILLFKIRFYIRFVRDVFSM